MTANYTKVTPAPPLRDPNNSSIQIPGLYPSELAVTLNDRNNAHVAVYADIDWLDNNQGAIIYASARYCNADWSTYLTPGTDHEVVSEHRFTADAGFVAKYGTDVLARECMLLVLGEAPTLVDVPVDAGQPAQQAPIVAVDDMTRMNASIRHAIDIALNVGPTNAGSLL